MTIDKVRAKEKESLKNEPDMRIHILFGGLFQKESAENFNLANFMKIKLTED